MVSGRTRARILFGCWLIFLAGGCSDSRSRSEAASETSGGLAYGSLELTFLAADSGAETPVRVQVMNAKGASYVAEDAILIGGHCRDSDAPLTREQAAETLEREVRNEWAQASQFYADGAARVVVPPGRYRVEVFKGFEHRVETREYSVAAGQTTSDSIVLQRWIDMPASGWFGSDGHLHIARPHPDDDIRLASWMNAEDIHIANLLQWGTLRAFHNARQYSFGDAGVHVGNADHLLIAGQEYPRTHFLGHIVVLGAGEGPRVDGSYVVTRAFFDEAHRSGGLAGYAHFAEAFGGRNGLAVDLSHEVVDFVEVVQVGRARYDSWYEALNAGYRIPPTAGTDYPCGHALPGAERFYTKVADEDLTRESWLAGIRRGNTFATNGPLLRLRVNGREMGDVLRLPSAQAVSIQGEVLFDRSRDDVTQLHLVQNGATLQTFAATKGATHIRFEIEHPVEQASWLAIRAVGRKLDAVGTPGLRLGLAITTPEPPGPMASEAHSAAVFIDIDGVPPMSKTPAAKTIFRKWIQRLDALEADLNTDHVGELKLGEAAGQVSQDYIRRNRPELRVAIQEARRVYAARLE
jgi:hypothetical protein